jgi:hypothetical protein
MGEEIDSNPKIFELPADGPVLLPEFEEIKVKDLPEGARFLINSDMGAIEATNRKMIKVPIKLVFEDAGTSYLVAYDFESGLEGLAKFRGVFAADISASGEGMGSGYSLIDLDEAGRENVRPYIGHTFTQPAFEHQGLGVRRLLIINEANKKWFKDSLGSGQFAGVVGEISHAKNIWELLVSKGLVIREGTGFRFKD